MSVYKKFTNAFPNRNLVPNVGQLQYNLYWDLAEEGQDKQWWELAFGIQVYTERRYLSWKELKTKKIKIMICKFMKECAYYYYNYQCNI